MIAVPVCQPVPLAASGASRARYAGTVTTDQATPGSRPLLTATILSIGAELTVGDTRDTNAGELARGLTAAGVAIERLLVVPDVLAVVRDAFAGALERTDLVVSTGGLGPTPDDLTREAIAEVCGETPVVDPVLERWLRALWKRRGLPFPESNRKQAWVIPSAAALPNPNGTAPGWFVRRPGGRVIVAMPGPPREMRPMWTDEALPRLQRLGLGAPFAARTFRTAGIGESQLAEVLGEAILRAPNPRVATYARADAVDVRIAAVDGPGADGVARTAAEHLAAMAAEVQARIGAHIWAEGDTSWPAAIGSALAARGWRLALDERGTGGQVRALFGDVDWLVLAEGWATGRDDHDDDGAALRSAQAVRARASVDVGLAVDAHEQGNDTIVTIALVAPGIEHVERRTAFLGGSQGRVRAALATGAAVVAILDGAGSD
jgi:nicotinamide-nucleotide amidase